MQQVLPKCAVNRGTRVWLNYEGHKQQGGKQQSSFCAFVHFTNQK